MLVRIKPEQIVTAWGSLRELIQGSEGEFIPSSEEQWNTLYKNLLSGRLIAHLFNDREGRMAGIVVLSFDLDPITSVPRIFIYLVSGVEELLPIMLQEIEESYPTTIHYTVLSEQTRELFEDCGYKKTITFQIKEV